MEFSYRRVVIMLGMMRTDELLATPLVPRAKGQLQQGFRYVISTPVLGSTLLVLGITVCSL